MKLRDTPTPHDYERLQRALRGGLASIVPFGLAVIALEFKSIIGAGEGSFCLVYCLMLLAACVWAWCSRFRPRIELTPEKFGRASTHGPRLYLLFGIGQIIIGLGTIPLVGGNVNAVPICLILTGLSFIFWSFQFPHVTLDPEAAKRWQFSIRAVLIVILLFSLYLAAVIWLTKPEEHIAVRCLKPLGPLIGIGLVCYLIHLVYRLVDLAICTVMVLLTMTFNLLCPRASSGSESTKNVDHHDGLRGD